MGRGEYLALNMQRTLSPEAARAILARESSEGARRMKWPIIATLGHEVMHLALGEYHR